MKALVKAMGTKEFWQQVEDIDETINSEEFMDYLEDEVLSKDPTYRRVEKEINSAYETLSQEDLLTVEEAYNGCKCTVTRAAFKAGFMMGR
jgi:hypothetical protein